VRIEFWSKVVQSDALAVAGRGTRGFAGRTAPIVAGATSAKAAVDATAARSRSAGFGLVRIHLF
jgi:hypothetical protein